MKTSVQRVLHATNSWLFAQTRNGPYRYEIDRGYACTFSALVLKSATAHIFHVGDARVYRIIDNHLEQLTEDHRLRVSAEKSHLSRALGMRDWLEIDYQSHALEANDIFVLATDGAYEFTEEKLVIETIRQHQDLRPNNIMIDNTGTVKLIDFGSVRVAGVAEIAGSAEQQHILGTAQYTAPEYFLGEAGTTRSDLFSLGVIAYQMLSGRVPYGTQVAKTTSRAAQRRLVYQSALDDERTIPAWVDEAIRKAVHPNPYKRHDEISEFVHDLRQPNSSFMNKSRPPLLERNPIMFWKGLASILFLIIVFLLSTHPVFNH